MDVLIPDLISLILEYLSLVELTELGLTRRDPMSEQDRLAFKMYTRGKVNTFKADFIHAAPDYLRYTILVHAKYPIESILTCQHEYMLDWFARSPKLSWKSNRCGGILLDCSTGYLRHDRFRTILTNHAFLRSIKQDTMERNLEKLFQTLPYITSHSHRPEYEDLAIWMIKQPFECNWLCRVIPYTLKSTTDRINYAILAQFEMKHPPLFRGGVDPLEVALEHNPKFILDVVKYTNLFIPRHPKYLSFMYRARRYLEPDQYDVLLETIGYRSRGESAISMCEPPKPDRPGLLTRLYCVLTLIYHGIS